MRITIEVDMTTTEHPEAVSASVQRLMLAARGMGAAEMAVSALAPVGYTMVDTALNISTTTAAAELTPEPSTTESAEAPKRRGRKTNAEKEAEALAQRSVDAANADTALPVSASIPEPVEPVVELPVVPANPTPSPVGAFPIPTFQPSHPTSYPPPGLVTQTPLPVAPTGAPVPNAQPQQPAMPEVPPRTQDSVFTVEDLKQTILNANAKQAGKYFQVMRQQTWSDGSAKDPWMRVEDVPADLRERLANEIAAAVGLGL